MKGENVRVDCPFCKREIATYRRGIYTPRGYSTEIRVRVHRDNIGRCPGSQRVIQDN